jgi:hypothetical protein
VKGRRRSPLPPLRMRPLRFSFAIDLGLK